MAGGRVRDSLDSVLRISQLESGRVRPNVAEFNIADLLRGSCKLHQEWADQEGLTLKTKGLEEPIQVCLDSKFVGQIVNNLLDNALKYTQEGEVELELEARAETIHLSVSDTGVGIAANEQKQIFRAYEQTDSARDSGVGGVGLGLAITSNLVESMGGRIRLESVPGEGSCFTVTLPRYCGPEDIPAGGPNAEQLLTSR
jgi:two-component system CheB/CheR fusion protein